MSKPACIRVAVASGGQAPLVVQWAVQRTAGSAAVSVEVAAAAAAPSTLPVPSSAGVAGSVCTASLPDGAGALSNEDAVAQYILASAGDPIAAPSDPAAVARWIGWKYSTLVPALCAPDGDEEKRKQKAARVAAALQTLTAAIGGGLLLDQVSLADLAIAAALDGQPKLPPALAEYAGRVKGWAVQGAGAAADEPFEAVGDCFYITTAINYTNGLPHFGHAYEAVVTDVQARYHRCYGRDVKFLTGTDEHGQKIAEKAEAEGCKPIENCDKYVRKFQELNAKLLISNDDFIRTTEPRHTKLCHWMWRQAAKAGDIYLDKYEGWYNVREETFVTEAEAKASDYKDPTSGKPLQKQSEASYFFRMSRYHDQLVQHITDHPAFIKPAKRRAEILARLEEPLRDLSISRTTFAWGIPVENDSEHVMYVWFDALSNYLSALGYPDGEQASKYWPVNAHVIGKDISWFHTVIWPCILLSTGVPLPRTVYAHGFVTDENGQKMSKSIGNVVDPHAVLNLFPADSLRYYIVRATPFGNDLPFSYQALADMHNGVLIKTVGNLVNRAVNITKKYCDGKVPDVTPDIPFDLAQLVEASERAYAAFKLKEGLEAAISAVSATNLYLTETEPWKCKDPAKRARSVRTSLEAVYVCTHFLKPVIPEAAGKIFEYLGTPCSTIKTLRADFQNLAVGTPVTVGSVLFAQTELPAPKEPAAADAAAPAAKLSPEQVAALQAKVDAQGSKVRELKAGGASKDAIKGGVATLLALKKELEAAVGGGGKKGGASKGKAAKPGKKQGGGGGGAAGGGAGAADASLFASVDIRVGKIVEVWEHPDSDKLWCEKIDVGEDEPRQIASGLRHHYSREEMQGRTILTICNLKTAKLAGFPSAGMVLCAKTGDTVEFVDPPAGAAPGDRVVVAGEAGEPASANFMKKKKVFEKVAKDLQTDSARVASYKGKPLLVGGKPCVAPTVANGPIS